MSRHRRQQRKRQRLGRERQLRMVTLPQDLVDAWFSRLEHAGLLPGVIAPFIKAYVSGGFL